MNALSLLGSTLGLGFAAGLNIYATVLVVGLGVRFGFIHLAPELSQLEVLANPYILAVAGFIYLIEFFADKIPWVDSFWDSFKKGFLLDRLTWRTERKQQAFHFFKHRMNHGQEVLQILQKANNEHAAADFRLANAAL
jgi:hypothetical protein